MLKDNFASFERNWRREIARDAMVFGSILFYAAVIARATVGSYLPFVYQLLTALAVLVVFSFLIKANQHVARTVPLLVFTTLFYGDTPFTAFAIILFAVMLVCSRYLKIPDKEITMGIVSGGVAAGISYAISYYFWI